MQGLKCLEIRHGSPEYLQTVELREAILRRPLGLRFSPEELQAEKDSHHLAACLAEKLVACVVLLPRSQDTLQLRQFAVHPAVQRQGIGTALVEYSESFARKLGYSRIMLHARETAVPFYEQFGYTKVGVRFVEVTLPHWELTKSL
jgi:predicted N-acetyltransferase YhbS